MSNPTTPFSWQMPTNTDLVTDLPADFEVFGQAVATSMADLLGGTTGQVLSKTTATDMDFTWINNDQGDLTAITAGTGISVTSGTGPIPSVAIDTTVTVDKTTAQTLTNKTLTNPLINPTISTQASAYTLVLADQGTLIQMSATSSVALTLPPSVFSAGAQLDVIATGVAGTITFTQGSGVTILSTGAISTAPKLRVIYSAATIICKTGGASPVFYVVGDIS